MHIHKMVKQGCTYYEGRESYREGERVRKRTISLGTQPTIEGAFRWTEARYFAARKGRQDAPLSDDDQKIWDRLAQLFDAHYRHKRQYIKLSSRVRSEQKRLDALERLRVLAEPRRIPLWCQTTLNLPENATPDEIRAARDRLAMQHHPDLGGDPSIMIQINEAYETLTTS
jgi:hypothetical protein